MGIDDRHYFRTRPAPAIGRLSGMSITMWLIVINFTVALIDSVLWYIVGIGYELQIPGFAIVFPPLTWWGHFSPALAIFGAQVWRFITFQFLHADIWHLVINLLMLYFFGPLIESYLGRRRFLAFYLICGMAGPVAYMVLWAASAATTGQLIVSAYVPLVGASAGLFGILIAAAMIAPRATVMVWGVLPVQMRTLAWIMLGIALWTVFTAGRNAGGEAAHLGGAAMGWLLIRNVQWLNMFDRGQHRFAR